MAAWNIPVDQVTYLDPHDFDQNIVPSQETEKRQWFLGAPAEPSIPVPTICGFPQTERPTPLSCWPTT